MTAADDGDVRLIASPEWFAHWLRAGSVVVIVTTHFVVNFWAINPESAALVHTRALSPETLHRVPKLIIGHEAILGFLPAAVAVGFFFLISGFVIPLTMRGKSVGRFLVVRAFRILPVWLLSLLVIAGLFALELAYAEVPIKVSAATWIANAATVPDLAYQPTLNPPGWTLFIEIKWYLLCALAAATVGLTSARLIAGASVVFALYAAVAWQSFASLAAGHQHLWVMTQSLAWDAPYLCIILIGACFYNRLRNGWSTSRMIIAATVCLASMAGSTWQVDDGGPYPGVKFTGYLFAIAVFTVAFVQRSRFRPNRLIGYLADMSFSLYVLHFSLGMVLIDTFARLTGMPLASTLSAAAVVMVVSMIVHRYVEAPAIRFGKTWRAQPVMTRSG